MRALNYSPYDDPWPARLALLATVVALALRLFRLDFQALWWDEGISLYLSAQGLDALVTHKDFALDLHPPLYHVLLALWTAIFGADAFTARAFSAVLGAANVPILFVLVRRLAGPVAGAAAATLLAVAPVHVFYSQEARMYSLVPLLATGSTLAVVWLADAGSRRGRLWATVAYVVSTAAGLWSYYYIGLLVIAQNLWVLTVWLTRRRGLRWWIAAQAGTAVAFAAWGAVLVNMVLTTDLWMVKEGAFGPIDLASFLRTFAVAYAVGFTSGDTWGPPLTGLFLGLAALGLLRGGTRDWRGRGLLVLWLVVPVLLAYGIATQRAFVFPRFVLFSALALYGLSGAGIALLWERWRPVAAVALALLLCSAGWSLYGHYTVPRTAFASSDYLVPLSEMTGAADRGDLLLSDQAWALGYARAYLPQPRPAQMWAPGEWSRNPERAERELGSLLGRHGRIWVLSWLEGGTWRGSKLEDALSRLAATRFVDQYGEFRLRLFGHDGTVPQPGGAAQRQDTVGTLARLVDYTREPSGDLAQGSGLQIRLTWQALAPSQVSYTVFVQLIGPDGGLVAQRDSAPVKGTHLTTAWSTGEVVVDRYTLSLPAGAPAGEYRLIAGMYDPATGQRLPVGAGDHVVLERIDVGRR